MKTNGLNLPTTTWMYSKNIVLTKIRNVKNTQFHFYKVQKQAKFNYLGLGIHTKLFLQNKQFLTSNGGWERPFGVQMMFYFLVVAWCSLYNHLLYLTFMVFSIFNI